MITIFADNREVENNYHVFSDGAITYKIILDKDTDYISINVDPKTPVRVIKEELGLVYNAILNQGLGDSYILLRLPYLPYARCDRVFEKGNPEGLRVFLDFLESLDKINVITTYDIHNRALIEDYKLNMSEVPQLECFKGAVGFDFINNYNYVVAPDKGSELKAKSISEYLNIPLIVCSKVRDISTGKILKSSIPDDVDLRGKRVLIPDDICDGGYTFIKLSEMLKGRGAFKVDLYVTHLIASKGLKVFNKIIDKIYYYDIVANYVNDSSVLEYNRGE